MFSSMGNTTRLLAGSIAYKFLGDNSLQDISGVRSRSDNGQDVIFLEKDIRTSDGQKSQNQIFHGRPSDHGQLEHIHMGGQCSSCDPDLRGILHRTADGVHFRNGILQGEAY